MQVKQVNENKLFKTTCWAILLIFLILPFLDLFVLDYFKIPKESTTTTIYIMFCFVFFLTAPTNIINFKYLTFQDFLLFSAIAAATDFFSNKVFYEIINFFMAPSPNFKFASVANLYYSNKPDIFKTLFLKGFINSETEKIILLSPKSLLLYFFIITVLYLMIFLSIYFITFTLRSRILNFNR